MATKACVVIQNIGYVGADEVSVSVAWCSCVASPQVDSGDTITVPSGVGFGAAIAAACQAAMETGGVSFTAVVDSIRVGNDLFAAT